MKTIRTIAMLALIALVAACGGGGGGTSTPPDAEGGDSGGDETGGDTTANTTLSDTAASATSQAISIAALSTLSQVGGAAPAGQVVTKAALEALKQSGSLSTTVTGTNGGSCAVTASGSSSTTTDPMTLALSGTMQCDAYAETIALSGGDTSVILTGAISISFTGSMSQDFSSIEISSSMSWTDLAASIAGTTYSDVSGDYTLSISGGIGSLAFAESGTVGNCAVSNTYTFTSELEETPEAPAEASTPTDPGTSEEENLDDAFVVTSTLVIYGQDGTFLGVVDTNRFNSDSVCNGFGTYGSRYSSYSIWNEYGTYGGDYGINSAFNEYGSYPPILYEWDGVNLNALYYVTTNPYKNPRIDAYAMLGELRSYGCNIER